MEAQKKLVEFISARGIKQSAIAAATGIDKDRISKSMRLERRLTVDEFGAVCSFLDVSMDTFR